MKLKMCDHMCRLFNSSDTQSCLGENQSHSSKILQLTINLTKFLKFAWARKVIICLMYNKYTQFHSFFCRIIRLGRLIKLIITTATCFHLTHF